jgi:hypothetical protein
LGKALTRVYVYARRRGCHCHWQFGLDAKTKTLGVAYVVTTDLGMVTNFNTHFPAIKNRFDEMVAHLPAPYRQATLPEVITPQTILAQW